MATLPPIRRSSPMSMATWSTDDAIATDSGGGFIGASDVDGGLQNYSGVDEPVRRIVAGLEVFDMSGVSISLEYDGAFGETTQSHRAAARFRFAF